MAETCLRRGFKEVKVFKGGGGTEAGVVAENGGTGSR